MKYFTLLYGDELKKAPEKKIVPADQFSQLVEGEELLTKIREEAERFREDVAKECETLKEQAEQAGFEAGKQQWAEQIALLEKEISEKHEELQKKIVPVTLQAAKKVVGRELETSDDTIADIVISNLRAIAGHQKVTIYCHHDDLDKLQANKERMKDVFERLESLAIQEREDIEPNGCVIETEAGIINAQWDNVWRALEGALNKILG